MKNIAITVALVAIIALGVAATVSAGSRGAKNAACDKPAACQTMSAADCGDCPPECEPCCEPCAPSGAAAVTR
jgi:hypothetical protein